MNAIVKGNFYVYNRNKKEMVVLKRGEKIEIMYNLDGYVFAKKMNEIIKFTVNSFKKFIEMLSV